MHKYFPIAGKFTLHNESPKIQLFTLFYYMIIHLYSSIIEVYIAWR